MDNQKQIFYLNGQNLTVFNISHIISKSTYIDLTPQAWQKVKKARQAIDHMMQDKSKVVYGITTGFGSFANISISPHQRKQLQLNLIRSHAVGVGTPVSIQIVKRMYILRINTLAKARSGIRPENLKKFINAFNCDFIPLVPSQGTVGASGDLCPLSHLALGLLGEGLAWDEKSKSYKNACDILLQKNIQPLLLMEKQGLALINGTQFMTAILSQCIQQLSKIFESNLILYSLAVDVFGVDKQLFSQKSELFYKQFNQTLVHIISKIRSLVSCDSEVKIVRNLVDDVSSLLDFPESASGVLQTINFCKQIIQQQMNGATDNPLVYLKQDGFQEDQLISGGNFHGQYVAKVADFLSAASFQIGKYSEARIQRYINGKISNLPPFLIKNGGLNSGFMIAQYTAAALLSQSKILTKPASVDSIVTSAGQEDHVSMGGYASRKLLHMLQNISNILGIQLLMASTAFQQVNYKLEGKLQKIINKVRCQIPPLLEDRYFAPQIAKAAAIIRQNLNQI